MNTKKILQLKSRKELQILKDKMRLARHTAELDVIREQMCEIEQYDYDDFINDEMLEASYAE